MLLVFRKLKEKVLLHLLEDQCLIDATFVPRPLPFHLDIIRQQNANQEVVDIKWKNQGNWQSWISRPPKSWPSRPFRQPKLSKPCTPMSQMRQISNGWGFRNIIFDVFFWRDRFFRSLMYGIFLSFKSRSSLGKIYSGGVLHVLLNGVCLIHLDTNFRFMFDKECDNSHFQENKSWNESIMIS